jgi:tetratricopeptide (TPR) repeat protein
MRDSLIAILQARASWYYGGDVQAVTCDGAAREMEELLQFALPPQEPTVVDLAAVHAIADVLRCRREAQGDPLDWEEVDLLEQACCRAVEVDKVTLKVRLADACYMQFERAQASGSAQAEYELDRAIEMQSAVLDEMLPTSERVRLLANAGNLFFMRYQIAAGESPKPGTERDLDQAIALLRRGADLAGHDDPLAVVLWNMLAAALSSRAGANMGFGVDAAEALSALRHAIASVPRLNETLTNLGASLLRRQMFASPDAVVSSDLDEAIVVLHIAADASAEAVPIRAYALGTLGEALQYRYDLFRRPADVEASIAAFTQAIDAGGADDSKVAQWRFGLGSVLRARFESLHIIDDLVGSEAQFRLAVAAADANSSLSAMNLAITLALHAGHNGQVEPLEEAIALFERVRGEFLNGSAHWILATSNYAGALQSRFYLTSNAEDLDRAIELLTQANSELSRNDPEQATVLANLAGLRFLRHRLVRGTDDLEQAIELFRRAREVLPQGHPEGNHLRVGMADAQLERFIEFDRPEDLDNAIAELRAAIQYTHDRNERRRYQAALARAVGIRFDRFGLRPDVEEAVATLQSLAHEFRRDEPEAASVYVNLSAALLGRARFSSPGGTTEASATAEEQHFAREAELEALRALENCPEGHPARAEALFNLGRALAYQAERIGVPSAMDRADAALAEAVRIRAAGTELRMEAARFRAALAQRQGAFSTVLEALDSAVALLPLRAWRGLDRPAQERHLRKSLGLASEAASVALQADKPERAVELLEAGRSVLWGQFLEIRDDLSGLAALAPQLVARMDQVRAELDSPSTALALSV